ncbi:very short patch repair endonuclease [Endozoicomonas sp. SESOKO1]|uniref:very short patch repair endonuclease n=1 Tax=Endozoicomonas sp. SESOKO1 TaxID=2828742 RepID=UPI0021473EDC|nr:DNA mismatch endonuclease Vsr [Endozoicomonas sp. SESOKO1]
MVDILVSLSRSRNMAKIKSKDTKPEMIIRKYLHAKGLRYRIHDKQLPGKPDIVLPRFKTVIFVHGCFWHRHEKCRLAYTPKTHCDFWNKKFEANVKRDRFVIATLIEKGWRIIIVWECAIRSKSRDEYLMQTYNEIFSDQQITHIQDM